MFCLNQLMDKSPFSLPQREKSNLYARGLSELTRHHYEHCPSYRKIVDSFGYDVHVEHQVEEVPFIPVRLFKHHDLFSSDQSKIVKTMTSSGTTGQKVSRIFLDKITAANQIKVLVRITSSFIGSKRVPMLVIDSPAVIGDRTTFSARGAGILGFALLGYDLTYALDEDMHLDFQTVEAFFKKHKDKDILIFGFTYMIWEYFYKHLNQSQMTLPMENAILLHGGGWKNLFREAVDAPEFKHCLEKVCGIKRIYNYYGMVEQTGSIFMECEYNHLHSSVFSDVIVRRHTDFSVCDFKEPGLVQLVSLLPFSYPGHSILSEDIGEVEGQDDCPCGRLGKYFKIHGRVERSELRGCSDTFSPTS
ncbi:MAG: acyl-protein synthetase [Thermodesulfobacteriota bacterium]|nr:acyl-protein synthetase [Thermodesulfobacteriota bacterium]